jgi:hypothetical protein
MYLKCIFWLYENNHGYGVLMNCIIKSVENQCKNNEGIHVKYKYVVTVVWNTSAKIKSIFTFMQ